MVAVPIYAIYEMKVLVIGSGGREHALVWKIKQSAKVEKIFCAPGNAGISFIAECIPIKVDDFKGLSEFVQKEKIDLTVVGPEVPLAGGIVDYFEAKNLKIFGPNKKAAQLEASKVFAKNIMQKYKIPTAAYKSFTDYSQALKFIDTLGMDKQIVVKADGLAAGKGVIICQNKDSAKRSVEQIMKEKEFGDAGKEVVIEEFLFGEEASVQLFVDGEHYQIMPAAQDHKRVFDNDQGPNTGGMGAYAPAPIIDSVLKKKVEREIIKPLIQAFKKEGIEYKGVLYIGLMICSSQNPHESPFQKGGQKGNAGGNDISSPVSKGGIGGDLKKVSKEPYVLEFNCRFGDPETQVVLPLLSTDLVEIIEKIIKSELDKIKIEWYNKFALCVVLASGGYPGDYQKGKTITGLDELKDEKDVIVFHAGTSFGDASKNAIVTSGGRVLGITALGRDIRQAIQTAYSALRKISFENMHYRKDIGRKAVKSE